MIRIQPNAQNEIIKNIMRTMALSVFVLNLCLEHPLQLSTFEYNVAKHPQALLDTSKRHL